MPRNAESDGIVLFITGISPVLGLRHRGHVVSQVSRAALAYPTSPHSLRGVGGMQFRIFGARASDTWTIDNVRSAKKMNSHFALTVVYAFQHVKNEFAFEQRRLGTDPIGRSKCFWN